MSTIDSSVEPIQAIYGELRRTAGGLMRRERRGHTLQASALVHEALLRLLSGEGLGEVSTAAPLAAAAQAMRQVWSPCAAT